MSESPYKMKPPGMEEELALPLEMPSMPVPHVLPEHVLPAPQLYMPPEQDLFLHQCGVAYHDDFITPEEEDTLIDAVDDGDWICDLQRRVQHYGWRYDYAERAITAHDHIGALPDWVSFLTKRMATPKYNAFADSPPDQLIVNEYEPGQGIAPHTDRDCFGAVVAAISIGSDCMMKLYPPKNTIGTDVVVLRRSLMIYRGLGRTAYRHALPPRKTDTQDGVRIPRTRRISFTFRTVIQP